MKELPSDWTNRMQNKRISSADSAKLDALLGAPEQAAIQAMMKSLPEETVSLQWRSALNERLLSLAPVKKKLSIWMIGMRAVAGAGVATAIAVLLLAGRHPVRTNSGSAVDVDAFASALISEHRQSVISSEIAGPGIVDGETERSSDLSFDSSSDSDSDSL